MCRQGRYSDALPKVLCASVIGNAANAMRLVQTELQDFLGHREAVVSMLSRTGAGFVVGIGDWRCLSTFSSKYRRAPRVSSPHLQASKVSHHHLQASKVSRNHHTYIADRCGFPCPWCRRKSYAEACARLTCLEIAAQSRHIEWAFCML